MLRSGQLLARRGASTGSASSASLLRSALFRRKAAPVVVAPQRSGGHGPVYPLWTMRPNRGIISRTDVEPGWKPPPPGPKKPTYESPLVGPMEVDKDFNVPNDLDLYWEDGIQREWIVDQYAPHISKGRALRMFISAFLLFLLLLMLLGFAYPYDDIAVPPMVPRETIERDYLGTPEQKIFYDDYIHRMKLKTLRVKLSASEDTRVTFFDHYKIFVEPILVATGNTIVRCWNRIFTPPSPPNSSN